MGVDVEEEAIDAQRKVPVQQRLDHFWRLVPHASKFCEAFRLDDVFAIDVTSADGIEHVVGFVVGGRIEPELTHRLIDILIMTHAVRDHRGRHTLRR